MKRNTTILFFLLLFANIRVSARIMPDTGSQDKSALPGISTTLDRPVNLWIEDEPDDMPVELEDTFINLKAILHQGEKLSQGAGIIISAISHLDPLTLDKPPPVSL